MTGLGYTTPNQTPRPRAEGSRKTSGEGASGFKTALGARAIRWRKATEAAAQRCRLGVAGRLLPDIRSHATRRGAACPFSRTRQFGQPSGSLSSRATHDSVGVGLVESTAARYWVPAGLGSQGGSVGLVVGNEEDGRRSVTAASQNCRPAVASAPGLRRNRCVARGFSERMSARGCLVWHRRGCGQWRDGLRRADCVVG